jgi:uncharacterized membrane protein
MILNKKYKLPFLALLLFVFILSKYFVFEKVTALYLLMCFVLYVIASHWIYAYVFNTNMHNHIGLVKPNEAKNVRFLSFLFGMVLGAYVVLFL